MAKCEKKPIGQYEYVLTLTEDEALKLRGILGAIDGLYDVRRVLGNTLGVQVENAHPTSHDAYWAIMRVTSGRIPSV